MANQTAPIAQGVNLTPPAAPPPVTPSAPNPQIAAMVNLPQDIQNAQNTVNPPQPTISPLQPTGQGSQVAPQQNGLDPIAQTLTKAISMQEMGGGQPNFNAPSGDDGSTPDGSTGHTGGGAWQWTSASWARDAQQVLGNAAAPMTPANQIQVAYTVNANRLNAIDPATGQKYTPAQVVSMWNAGPGEPNAYTGTFSDGTSSATDKFNVPSYVSNVQKYAQQLYGQQQSTQTSQTTPTGANTDSGSPSVGGFLGNVVSSGANFAGNLVNAAIHPIQTVQNIGSMAAGGLQELGGQTNDNTAKFDQLKSYLGNRYGSISNLEHTIYSDPIGFAADLSTVLGTGAGVAGLGAKAAELAGLGSTGIAAGGADFVAGAEGAGAASTQATAASGLAGGLKATAGALGTAAKYTNPLTPIVAGGSALLNKVKNASDVFANPQNYSAAEIANAAPEKVVGDVQTALEDARNGLSETGSGYAPFRETPTAITTEPAQLDNILRDSLKVDVTDGVIKPTSTSLLRDQASITKLQNVYNTYKTDFLNGSMDSEKLLNMRTDLANIAYNDLGIKNSDVATMAAKVRATVNDTFRGQVPGLSELDNQYSTQLNNLNDLQDGIIYKTGSNKGELKTSFLNSAMRAVKNEDSAKLAQLEQILPGITKRLQIAKTIKDLGDPSFTTSLVEKGGVVGGLLAGNIQGAAMAFASIIISKPAIAIPLMRAVGASLDMVKATMVILSKSLTAGAASNNAQQATPQTPEQQTTTDPQQETATSPTVQIGNPSDLTSLAANKSFDITGARAANYSDADILSFLQSQK